MLPCPTGKVSTHIIPKNNRHTMECKVGTAGRDREVHTLKNNQKKHQVTNSDYQTRHRIKRPEKSPLQDAENIKID